MAVYNFRKNPYRYIWVAFFLLLAIAISGGLLNIWLTKSASLNMSPEAVTSPHGDQLAELFSKAIQQMQSGEYDQALKLWHSALEINPEIPEVKVNMGFSLFEKGDYKNALDSFASAIELNAFQANAYYGLAICYEKLGDLEAAIGAMKSFIHLAQPEHEAFIRKARSALWEWESSFRPKQAQK